METTENFSIRSRPILATPGPTNVSYEVQMQILAGNLNQKSKVFREALIETNILVAEGLGLECSHRALTLGTSGTGALEAICKHIRRPILVVSNGRYARRIYDLLANSKHDVQLFEADQTEPITSATLEDIPDTKLAGRDFFVVHQETQTGIVNDLQAITSFAKALKATVHCDAMSMAFSYDYSLFSNTLGFLAASSNKCLESVPGVSFVIFPLEHEFENQPSQGITQNLWLHNEGQSLGNFPHTPPVGIIMGARSALASLRTETLGGRIKRYHFMVNYLRQRLKNEGLQLSRSFAFSKSHCITIVELPSRIGRQILEFNDCRDESIPYYFFTDDEMIEKGLFSIATMGSLEREQLAKLVDNFVSRVQRADI